MWKYVTTLACGVAIGVIIDKVVHYVQVNKKIKYSKVLEDCFGEPMYTNTVTASDIRDWCKAREDSLKTGEKIIVTKAIPEKLKEMGKEIEIGKGIDNYLVIALVDNKEIKESLLIKYEKIEDSLSEALDKGNGTMVVGG